MTSRKGREIFVFSQFSDTVYETTVHVDSLKTRPYNYGIRTSFSCKTYDLWREDIERLIPIFGGWLATCGHRTTNVYQLQCNFLTTFHYNGIFSVTLLTTLSPVTCTPCMGILIIPTFYQQKISAPPIATPRSIHIHTDTSLTSDWSPLCKSHTSPFISHSLCCWGNKAIS